MNTVQSNSYEGVLAIYQKMASCQKQLEADLAHGNETAAEGDIEEMEALVSNMNLVGHSTHFASGPLAEDTLKMMSDLDQMMGDVEKGNFKGAETQDMNIGGTLPDIFQRIVSG